MVMVVDFNHVAIANLMQQANTNHNIIQGESKLREMILDTLRKNIKTFKSPGQVIIAVDGKACWRKAVFPYYKHRRAEDKVKANPNINWSEVYQTINKLAGELKENFPYVVITHQQAEGDDIIGEIVRHYLQTTIMEDIIILSTDKDFKQLHYNTRVKQYSPTLKKYVMSEGAEIELRSIIITGDRLDGVPNILSPDTSFVTRTKQSKLTAKRREYYMSVDPENIEDPDIKRNFVRNSILVDLDKTPGGIKADIRNQLNDQLSALASPAKIFPYLVEHGLTELQQRANDFI